VAAAVPDLGFASFGESQGKKPKAFVEGFGYNQDRISKDRI
jgi:hypothetical protein